MKEQSGYYQCTGKGAMKGIMTKWSSETATPTVSENLPEDWWLKPWMVAASKQARNFPFPFSIVSIVIVVYF